jgi:hypothetical protein
MFAMIRGTRIRDTSRLLGKLAFARSGVAAVEFALSLPLLLIAGLYGVETANLAVTHMRISQIAMQIADDASRIGDQSALQNKKIYESDINDLLLGGQLQGGGLNVLANGRVIISSLEVVPNTTNQYIHWQRCKGVLNVSSAYGTQGTGTAGGLNGMGPAGNIVTANPGDAVMFVEITYNYQPIVGTMFATNRTISTTASFNVRDSRDLSQVYQLDAANPSPVASCSTYTAS